MAIFVDFRGDKGIFSVRADRVDAVLEHGDGAFIILSSTAAYPPLRVVATRQEVLERIEAALREEQEKEYGSDRSTTNPIEDLRKIMESTRKKRRDPPYELSSKGRKKRC